MKTKAIKWIVFALIMALWHPAMSQHYEHVGTYHDDRAVVQKIVPGIGTVGYYGYVNEYNKLVIPMEYTYACNFQDGIAVVGIGSKKGIIGKSGKAILPVVYDDIEVCDYDHCKIRIAYDWEKEVRFYVIDKDGIRGVLNRFGKVIVPREYRAISTDKKVDKYYFVAVRPDGNRDLYDTQGEMLLPKGYALPDSYDDAIVSKYGGYCDNFDSYYVVVKDGKFGVVNLVDGKIVLEAEYDWVNIDMNCFITVKNGLYGLVKNDGTIIYPNIYKRISDPYVYNEKDEFGVFDAKKAEEILPVCCRNVRILKSSDDYFITKYSNNKDEFRNRIVQCGDKYCFLGSRFNDSRLFDAIQYINDEVFIVKYNGKYGIVIIKNKMSYELLLCEYETIIPDVVYKGDKTESVFHCKKGEKWGVCLLDNETQRTDCISDTRMQYVESSNDCWIASNNGKFGFYVPDGKTDFKYDKMPVPCKDGNGWIVEKDGKKGFWNREEWLSPDYDAIQVIGNPSISDKCYAITQKDGKNFFIRIVRSQECSNPVELPYQKIEYKGKETIVTEKDKKLANSKKCLPVFAVMKGNKWGYIGIDDDDVLIISKPKFDEAGDFKNGKASVRKGRKTYYIDVKGKEVK